MKSTNASPAKAEHDKIVIEAIDRARNAMLLLHDSKITCGKKVGYIDFTREINMLTLALRALGLDASLPVRSGKDCRARGDASQAS